MKLTFSRNLLVPAIAGGILLGMSTQGFAQSIYTSGHGDIGAGYDTATDEFEPHWHLHSGAVVDGVPLGSDAEYEPLDLNARSSATRLSPTGLSAGIGVADGSSIYVMGSSAYQPNLGFGVEELAPGDWTGDITLTLSGWTLPTATADFALYTTNITDTSVVDVVFSTHAPAATYASNSFTMTPGDHVHFQWGFTELGDYDLDFTWSGTHATDGPISTTETFTAQVVPEPSSLLLVGVAGLGLLIRRRLQGAKMQH